MGIKTDQTLNCVGLFCPEPVIKTKEELDKMQVNQTLEVLADDPAAESDIKSLVKRLNQQLVNVSKDGSIVHIVIKKVR